MEDLPTPTLTRKAISDRKSVCPQCGAIDSFRGGKPNKAMELLTLVALNALIAAGALL